MSSYAQRGVALTEVGIPCIKKNGQPFDCSVSATVILTGYALSRQKISLYANGFLRPVTDGPQRRHFTAVKKGWKGDNPELHKVACRFARRLPEGHCRMAVTPYPAYKNYQPNRPLLLAYHRQEPLHRPRAFKAPPAQRDIGIKLG